MMKPSWWRPCLLIIVLGLFFAGGCSSRLASTFDGVNPASSYHSHTVRWPGENLIRISWWYTGSGKNWQQIADANPTLKPQRIQIGDSVRIPVRLLKTREPMPKNYRLPVAKKPKQISTPIAKPPARDEEIELFGPVDSEAQDTPPSDVFIIVEPDQQ
jgi:LysM domain